MSHKVVHAGSRDLAESKPGYCSVSNAVIFGPPSWGNPGNEVSCLLTVKAKVILEWRKVEMYPS